MNVTNLYKYCTFYQTVYIIIHPGKYTLLWSTLLVTRLLFPASGETEIISATGQTLARATGRCKSTCFLFVFFCLLAPVSASVAWWMVDYEFRRLTQPQIPAITVYNTSFQLLLHLLLLQSASLAVRKPWAVQQVLHLLHSLYALQRSTVFWGCKTGHWDRSSLFWLVLYQCWVSSALK